MQTHQLGSCRLVLERGDLTQADVDAIVNAANSAMLGGGGVDGAIHRAAGPRLVEACREVPATDGVRCPAGEARITPGFGLTARHVIHTVGPIFESLETSAPVLQAAHRASFALAREHGLRSIAFPAISCGVYRFPIADAARIAITAARAAAGDCDEIRFVLFTEDTFEAWTTAADALCGEI